MRPKAALSLPTISFVPFHFHEKIIFAPALPYTFGAANSLLNHHLLLIDHVR
jgi:hypothetical protein